MRGLRAAPRRPRPGQAKPSPFFVGRGDTNGQIWIHRELGGRGELRTGISTRTGTTCHVLNSVKDVIADLRTSSIRNPLYLYSNPAAFRPRPNHPLAKMNDAQAKLCKVTPAKLAVKAGRSSTARPQG